MHPLEAKAESFPKRYIVGVSGASGAVYAARLIEAIVADPRREAHVIVTPAGQRVLAGEMDPVASAGSNPAPDTAPKSGLLPYLNLSSEQRARVIPYACGDIGAGPASGTYPAAAMIVVPCSMNTLAAISHGLANNLLLRAAAVTLKEGRPLILVPRETPLTLIDIRNMASVAEAGGVLLPANPGFYHRPQSVDDLVRYVVQKIFDRLGLEFPKAIRWGESEG